MIEEGGQPEKVRVGIALHRGTDGTVHFLLIADPDRLIVAGDDIRLDKRAQLVLVNHCRLPEQLLKKFQKLTKGEFKPYESMLYVTSDEG